MAGLTLYGADYSVYVRIARLVLEELGIAHERVPVDIFAKTLKPANYRTIHPFGKIPALDHDGFRLFETDAIAHYLIALEGNRTLLPEAPEARARTIQLMRIMDAYAYPSMVWGVYVEEKEHGAQAETAEALDLARAVLHTLDELGREPFFLGDDVTLADLWAYPILAYFALAPSGAEAAIRHPWLTDWMARMAERDSVQATHFPAELASAE